MALLPRLRLLAALAAAALAGCGSSGVTPPKSVPETAQPPAAVPAGWVRKLDNEHGFSIAVPPGWQKSTRGDATLFRSPDHLVAVTLSVDRTSGAFATPVDEFARRTLVALPGYKGKLIPSPPKRIAGTPLDTAVVSSVGEAAASGVRQDISVAVLRRDHFVNYTAVIAANAAATPAAELALARQMLATLRDLPIA